MLERAGSLVLQFAKKFIVRVAKLTEPRTGNEVEHPLEQIDERVAGNYEHRTDEHVKHRHVRVIVHHVDHPETEISHQDADEHDSGHNELLPSLVEETGREYRDYACQKEHHEKHDTILGENQKRQERHAADREDHLVLEESLKVQGSQRERYHVEAPWRELIDYQSQNRSDDEYEDQIPELTVIHKQSPVQEIDHQEKQQHKRERDKGVAEPE